MGPQDILIEPALGLAASTDFTFAAGLVVKGEAAAREAEPRLMALRVDDRAYQAYLSRRAAREPALPTIRFVQVDEPSKRYETTILAEMQPLIGKPLDVDALDARIKNLYGLGYFETLDYSRGRREAGGGAEESGLEIRARRKSWGPTYLRFGLNLQDDFQGNNHYNATARFLMSEINSLGAELLTDVQIGSDPKLTSEFYQPLDALHTWFVAPSARIEGRDLPIYANNTANCRFSRSRSGGVTSISAATSAIGARSASGCTASTAWSTTAGAIRIWSRPQYNNGEYFFKFTYDQLDNVRFPRDGQTFSLQWDANRTNLGADFGFDRVTADWLMARSRGRNTLLLWTSAGSDPGRQPATDGRAGLLFAGRLLQSVGPRALIPDRSELRDRARHLFPQDQPRRGGVLRVSRLYRHVARSRQYLGGPGRYAIYGSAHKDASVFVAFDTFLGPVYLGTGYDNRGHAGVLPVSRPHLLDALRSETAAFREILHLFEHQRGLIADSRIFVLTRHIFQHAVALGRGEKPMGLLPVGAEQLRERVAAAAAARGCRRAAAAPARRAPYFERSRFP